MKFLSIATGRTVVAVPYTQIRSVKPLVGHPDESLTVITVDGFPVFNVCAPYAQVLAALRSNDYVNIVDGVLKVVNAP